MSILIELLPSAGPALVIGGGAIAARKVATLLEGGFTVTVIAPEIAPDIAADPRPSLHRRPFADADLDAGPWALVLACTSSRQLNARIGGLARAHRIPVLVADSRDESTFATPAVHRDGDLVVAVSTTGADPALAARIRDQLARALGPGRAAEVAAARAARAARRSHGDPP